MRKRAFEKLLKAAIILEAEEQGARMTASDEPIPAAAQARFDAALNGTKKQRSAASAANGSTADPSSAPQKSRRNWLGYGLAAASLAAVVLVVGLMIRLNGDTKSAPMAAEPQAVEATAAPRSDTQPTQEPEYVQAPESQSEPEPGGEAKDNFGPTFVLNGKTLNVYTEHYFIAEDETSIPLNAFLMSVGAVYADSPYNRYQVQCYEIQGIRYIYDWESQVFAFADAYDDVVKTLKAQDKTPTKTDFRAIDLFAQEGYELEMQAETWVNSVTLERVLRGMGLDITIEIDREANAIRVELADPQTDSTAIPEDSDRPALQLKTYAWQGYTCLVPETFDVTAAMDQELSATEKALLMWDTDALQTVGLTDMDYYLVAESMLNGKDLLTWYLTADGWDDKPEDFDTAESVEIVPGIVSVHYYNRNYDSYICIAKLNTIDTNILFLSASSLTKDGTADFDSIVKRFVKMNGDFAPSDNDTLNGKYGKSKVFAGDGYQITLTEQFSEQKSEMGFIGYYTAYYGAVMIRIEPFTLKAGLADETLTEYMENVIRNNNSDAQPEERDGLIFYRYRRDGMCGWNFAFKGDTAFYLVQFMCREADESELTDLFFAFAKSMKIMDRSGNAVNG